MLAGVPGSVAAAEGMTRKVPVERGGLLFPAAGRPMRRHRRLVCGFAAGERRSMSKAWIEQLAVTIKEKDREAANAYGREQHRLGVVNAKGHEFFAVAAQALEVNFSEIKAQLQGDVTASETSIETNGV